MKTLQFSALVIFLTFFMACKDDDNGNCTQSDWVGTYSGTVNCGGLEENVTVTITASGASDVMVSYQSSNISVEYTSPLTPNGCAINYTATDQGFTTTINATLTGEALDFTDSESSGGSTGTCNIIATRD